MLNPHRLSKHFTNPGTEFAGMLNEMRLGKISDDSIRTFKELARPLTFDDGLDVTELYVVPSITVPRSMC
jgi:ATP-dependent DNA helicase PIF1